MRATTSGYRYGALEAGPAITPFAVGWALTAAIGGRIVHHFGRSLVAVVDVLVDRRANRRGAG